MWWEWVFLFVNVCLWCWWLQLTYTWINILEIYVSFFIWKRSPTITNLLTYTMNCQITQITVTHTIHMHIWPAGSLKIIPHHYHINYTIITVYIHEENKYTFADNLSVISFSAYAISGIFISIKYIYNKLLNNSTFIRV